MKKYHIGENGPSICKVDESNPNSKGCPLGGEHFSSLEEAESHFEKIMESQGHGEIESVSKGSSMKKISKEIDSLIDKYGLSVRDIPLEKVEEIGSRIDDEVFSRAGLEKKEEYKVVELEKLAKESSAILKEIQGQEVERKNTYHGPLAKHLEESLKVLPTGAIAFTTRNIHTKTVHGNVRNFSGQHVGQASVPENPEERGVFHLGDDFIKLEEGEFYYKGFSINEEGFLGSRISKVTEKAPDRDIDAGDSVYENQAAKQYYLKLLEKGYINKNMEVVPEHVDDLRREYPHINEQFKNEFKKKDYWVGKKPTGNRTGEKYKKVGNEVTVKLINGKEETLNLPLYEISRNTVINTQSTISSTKPVNKSAPIDGEKSVLLHEFTHEIQLNGGAIGEGDIFNQMKKGSLKSESYGRYRHYEGFPDEYMGDQGGREVLTRTTEGIFYPKSYDEYIYSTKNEGSERLRKWGLGVWAIVSVAGREKMLK